MANKAAKGSEFERQVCRQLTEWVTGKRRPEIFWRSATSGAKATSEIKAGRRSHMGGDIVAIHPEGQWFTTLFSVECKNRKSFGALPYFLLGEVALYEWWARCCLDAVSTTRVPLLIFRQLFSQTFAATRPVDNPFQLDGWKGPLIELEGLPPFRVGLLESLLELNSDWGVVRDAHEMILANKKPRPIR